MEEPEELMDQFSIEDRRELIKQGITLERITEELAEIRSTLLRDHDGRLQSLEDDRIRTSTQVKTILWLGGFLVTVVQVVVEVSIHLWLKAT